MPSFERDARAALHRPTPRKAFRGSVPSRSFQDGREALHGPVALERRYHEIAADARAAILLLLGVLPDWLTPIEVDFAIEIIYDSSEALVSDRGYTRAVSGRAESSPARNHPPAIEALVTIDHDAAMTRSGLADALSEMIQLAKALAATERPSQALLANLKRCVESMDQLFGNLAVLGSKRADALADLADLPSHTYQVTKTTAGAPYWVDAERPATLSMSGPTPYSSYDDDPVVTKTPVEAPYWRDSEPRPTQSIGWQTPTRAYDDMGPASGMRSL